MGQVKYAVYCKQHKLVPLSDDEYYKQVADKNILWLCPVCQSPATWDFATHDAYLATQDEPSKATEPSMVIECECGQTYTLHVHTVCPRCYLRPSRGVMLEMFTRR